MRRVAGAVLVPACRNGVPSHAYRPVSGWPAGSSDAEPASTPGFRMNMVVPVYTQLGMRVVWIYWSSLLVSLVISSMQLSGTDSLLRAQCFLMLFLSSPRAFLVCKVTGVWGGCSGYQDGPQAVVQFFQSVRSSFKGVNQENETLAKDPKF